MWLCTWISLHFQYRNWVLRSLPVYLETGLRIFCAYFHKATEVVPRRFLSCGNRHSCYPSLPVCKPQYVEFNQHYSLIIWNILWKWRGELTNQVGTLTLSALSVSCHYFMTILRNPGSQSIGRSIVLKLSKFRPHDAQSQIYHHLGAKKTAANLFSLRFSTVFSSPAWITSQLLQVTRHGN